MVRFTVSLVTLAVCAALSAQTSAGPKVGDVVPEFSLVDQTGATRTLKSLLGPNGAVIVFFRSADW
jgi:hypothetical protein